MSMIYIWLFLILIPLFNSCSDTNTNVCTTQDHIDTSPNKVICDLSSYDSNDDGFLQVDEFPCPVGETFGIDGEYSDIYSIVAQYYVGKLKDNSVQSLDCYDLFIPSIRVALKYEDEKGNINYVIKVLVCVYYDIGMYSEHFPKPVYYDSGGMGSLCHVIISSDGALVSVEEAPNGSNSSWYYKFCGPYSEIAETLLGLTDTEVDYLFEMSKDFDELASAYLRYYFDD